MGGVSEGTDLPFPLDPFWYPEEFPEPNDDRRGWGVEEGS
jgi:hypothetical protein